jgi:hypothetical protein
MSAIIQKQAVELLWKQWTALGVAGVGNPAKQAIDLEALIAFTPFVGQMEPRLIEESIDWCARIGTSFISISRLRQILRTMPSCSHPRNIDLPSMVLGTSDLQAHRLSRKSSTPSLERPSLLQLRSRFIFGVCARADVFCRLVMQGRIKGGQRISEIHPSGYTKAAISTVLDELARAGVLNKLLRKASVRYELTQETPLRALLGPLPRRSPPWVERFALAANVLETARKFGDRATYPVELAKVLDSLRPLAAETGHHVPVAEPERLVRAVDIWITSLLDDEAWEDTWIVNGEDIAPRIVEAFTDKIVQVVQAGDYPVGYTELSDFLFRIVDRKQGIAEFVVQFAAEHPSEDFSFDGHVEGKFRFDHEESKTEGILASMEIEEAHVDFDMGAPPT